jgi:hypothetical protein
MDVNFLDLLYRALGPDFASLASKYLGEPEKPTQTSIENLLPVLLGGLFQKGCAVGGASPLMSQITGANVDPAILDNIPGLFAGDAAGANGLVKAGENLLNWLFGNKIPALATALASLGGIKSGSATKLMALVAPFVFGFLKKYIGEKGIHTDSLVSLLTGHEKNLACCIDNRLASSLGFSSSSDYLHCRMPAAAARPAAAYAAPVKKASWLPWLLGGLGLLAGLLLWQFLSQPTAPPKPVAQVPAPVKAVVVDCGLPSKVYFEVASAVIGPEGLKVIKEAAACINAKGLKVDITGYTDKTGDFDKNLELAKNRAKAVQDALVAEGLTVETINLTAPLLHTVVGTTGTGTDAEARRVEINKAGVLNVSLLFWQQQKDLFLQNYTDRLQGLNKKIDDLKALMATAKPETKTKLQAALNLLLEKQAAITKLLAGSKEASGKAWDDLKASLDDSLKQLTQEVDKTSKP